MRWASDSPGPGVSAHTVVLAAEGVVARDFVETLVLPDGRTALVQGDASGHGVEAGLLAVQAKSGVVALRLGRSPEVAAAAAWSALAREDERFTTLVVVLVDPRRRRITWLNAGHEIALLRRADGSVQPPAATGPVIGSFLTDPEHAWGTRETAFEPAADLPRSVRPGRRWTASVTGGLLSSWHSWRNNRAGTAS
ncbi:PP2C family protein-serine/threonine phosphatase [Kitasatospora sp. NPDC127035]|uniref:PP2C family protein-serine/threonine phosphatase n=1 Tax=Kitasatospora sp. NPDC127035 TaxID=3347111 RepID=UPI0036547215